MTKEVDFLSLSKTNTTKISSGSNNTTSTKKEGLSLFDSFLVDNKVADNSSSLEKDNNLLKTSIPNATNEEVDVETEKNTSNNNPSKTLENKENTTKLDSENNKTLNTKEVEKSEIKSAQSSSSLLDKMIIEAKKDLKTTPSDTLAKNVNINNTLGKNQETVVETPKSETSLLDKLEKVVKVGNESKNIIDSSLNKENITKNLNAELNPENIKNLNETSKESKTENISKVQTIALTNELTIDREIEKNNEAVTKVNEKELIVKVENKIELKDSKETKEQIQTTLSFEETPNDELKDKPKTEIKNPDIIKNILDNNVEKVERKVENKEESKNISKEEVKTEIKNPDIIKNILDNNVEKIETKVENKEESKNISKEEVKTETKNPEIIKNILDNNVEKIETKVENKEESKNLSKVEIKTEIKSDKNIEENKTPITEKQSSISIAKNVNEEVSKEFSKLDSNALVEEDQKVNIDKNTLLNNNTTESKNTKSLMDRLLDNATKTVNLSTNINQEDVDLQLQTQTTSSKTNEFVTNILLGSQKNSIYNQMIANRSEGVKVVKDGKNLEDIKKGAEILNLGLKETSVETEVQSDSSKTNVNKQIDNKENNLSKLAFNRNTNNENLENKLTEKLAEKLETKALNTQNLTTQTTTSTTLNSTSLIEEPVTLSVNPSLVLSIQNRIIGAQQHMSSMMSDVARNMYENYKPPITAFRINLFPAQLGQIAILMKNDKENSISISLSMSNSNTLDAFVEGQSTLRDALNRNFNNNQTTFNLDFNMDSESSGKQSFNEENHENDKNNENPSSNEIIEAINQNQNTGEDLNYL